MPKELQVYKITNENIKKLAWKLKSTLNEFNDKQSKSYDIYDRYVKFFNEFEDHIWPDLEKSYARKESVYRNNYYSLLIKKEATKKPIAKNFLSGKPCIMIGGNDCQLQKDVKIDGRQVYPLIKILLATDKFYNGLRKKQNAHNKYNNLLLSVICAVTDFLKLNLVGH